MQDLTKSKIYSLLPCRAPTAHKATQGSVVALAGSTAYRGAAALCVEGALRTGAGLVYLASIEPVLALALARTPECCALPCRTADAGGPLPADAAARCTPLAAPRAVLLAGPGLGSGAGAAVAAVLNAPWGGAVLDADALNALAAGQLAAPLPNNCVLTPHPGEMARLLHTTPAAVQADRAACAAQCARATGCVVVLKGPGTLIAAPSGAMRRNTTGNAGLARGGSGDVLAGMIAALLAQGLPAFDAAACGVWLHGAAADACAARQSMAAMLPHDILQDLGGLFLQAEQSQKGASFP